MKFVYFIILEIFEFLFYFNQISRLQQDIDLQGQIRDEMIIEFNNTLTDENTKRKIQQKIANIDEKIQALGMFFIPYH